MEYPHYNQNSPNFLAAVMVLSVAGLSSVSLCSTSTSVEASREEEAEEVVREEQRKGRVFVSVLRNIVCVLVI